MLLIQARSVLELMSINVGQHLDKCYLLTTRHLRKQNQTQAPVVPDPHSRCQYTNVESRFCLDCILAV